MITKEDTSYLISTPGQKLACGSNVSWACPQCGLVHPRPLAVSMREFCRLTSLGRTTAFALAREGEVEVRRVSGRTLILTRSIDRLLDLACQDDCARGAKREAQ